MNENTQNLMMDEINIMNNSLIRYEKKYRILTFLSNLLFGTSIICMILFGIMFSLLSWLILMGNHNIGLPKTLFFSTGILMFVCITSAFLPLVFRRKVVNDINKIENEIKLIYNDLDEQKTYKKR